MRHVFALTASVVTMAFTSFPAQAVTLFSDLSAWQAAVGSFNRDTSYGSQFSSINSLTLDDGTQLAFGNTLEIYKVPDSWGSWSGGYTDQVLYTLGATTVSATLSPTAGFGFFIEPNPFEDREFTFLLSDGSSLSATYNGSAGAGFLGFAGSGVTGFSVSSSGDDFAFGDFYSAAASTGAVPEPSTWLMMMIGFGLVGGAIRRRNHIAKVSYAF